MSALTLQNIYQTPMPTNQKASERKWVSTRFCLMGMISFNLILYSTDWPDDEENFSEEILNYVRLYFNESIT